MSTSTVSGSGMTKPTSQSALQIFQQQNEVDENIQKRLSSTSPRHSLQHQNLYNNANFESTYLNNTSKSSVVNEILRKSSNVSFKFNEQDAHFAIANSNNNNYNRNTGVSFEEIQKLGRRKVKIFY